jgi:Ca2+:H+ antiporter
MPGLCMIVGGIKHKKLSYNKNAINVSSMLLVMSIVGAYTPTIFYQILGSYSIDCRQCHLNDNIQCQGCLFTEKDYHKDPVYHYQARMLMYMCAILLPLSYIIGLIYSMHTHKKYIHRPSTNQVKLDSVQWSKITCFFILLISAILLCLISRVISRSLKPAFMQMNINIEYAGLLVFPLFTLFPKLVTAIEFALINDITKSLELCNLATLQVALLQMPMLCIISALLSSFYIYQESWAFTFIFPTIQIYAVTIATVVLCYVTIEGSCNYMQGTSLVMLYILIMLMFYVKYL